jgi:hypothetical protein
VKDYNVNSGKNSKQCQTCADVSDLDALESSTAFRKISRQMLLIMVQELSGSALKAYFILYDQSELIRYKTGKRCRIKISYDQLGKKILRSEATAGRVLKELKDKGYGIFVQQGKQGDNYFPNEILVGFPQHHVRRILAAEPNRKNNTNKIRPVVNNLDEQHTLLQQLNTKITSYRESGLKPYEASEKAFAEFTKNEQAMIYKLQKQVSKIAHPEQALFFGSFPPKMAEGGLKNDVPLDNNREYNLLLTVGDEKRAQPDVVAGKNTTSVNSVVKNKNISIVAASTLSEQEMQTIQRKIHWMKKSNKIQGEAQGRNLEDVIAEVVFHVRYRSQRTPTFKHALRAAAKLLREGKWKTPKRLSRIQSINRENQAQRDKQQELMDFCAVWGTQITSSLNLNCV